MERKILSSLFVFLFGILCSINLNAKTMEQEPIFIGVMGAGVNITFYNGPTISTSYNGSGGAQWTSYTKNTDNTISVSFTISMDSFNSSVSTIIVNGKKFDIQNGKAHIQMTIPFTQSIFITVK